MPVYEFMCNGCKAVFDKFFKMDECPDRLLCPMCDKGEARKVIAFNGAIQSDTPAWINDHLREALQKDGEKPIETRTEYEKYLKDNNYVPRA
jgi:putative FmdB family regulatory protein